jgi:hypothetical protein
MSGKAAAGRRHTRLSPAHGIRLFKRQYELRAPDGKLICMVSRGRAEQGIADGKLELWDGPHGVYLRARDAKYPDSCRIAGGVPDSRHPLHGTEANSAPNLDAVFHHNDDGCRTWRKDDRA